MKKLRLFICLSLCAVFLLTLSMPAFAATKNVSSEPSSKKPLSSSDFTLKIGNKSFNMLTQGKTDIEKMVNGKFKKSSDDPNSTYTSLYTNEAIFLSNGPDLKTKKPQWDSSLIIGALLNGSGTTSRGIKIGSTQQKLLDAYPKFTSKLETTVEDKEYIVYRFNLSNKSFTYSKSELNSVIKKRPLEFYGIEFTIDKDSGFVSSIWYFINYEYVP